MIFVIRDNTNACLLTGTRVVEADDERTAWEHVAKSWPLPPYNQRDDCEYQIVPQPVEKA